MEITITADKPDITIHPGSLEAEVVQNIRMILTTVKGTLPLDRNFGLSPRVIDTPIERAKALVVKEIHEQVNRYESRARIVQAGFSGDNATSSDGRLLPWVIVRIADE